MTLFEERRLAAVASTSVLAERAEIRWDEVPNWSLVVNTVSGSTDARHWEPHHAPTSMVCCTNYDEWLESVAADRGVGVVPEVASRRSAHAGVQYIPIPDAPISYVRLLYLARKPSALLRRFLDAALNSARAPV